MWSCLSGFVKWTWRKSLHDYGFWNSQLSWWTDLNSAELRIIIEHLSKNCSLWVKVITGYAHSFIQHIWVSSVCQVLFWALVGARVNKAIWVPAHLCSLQLKYFHQLGDPSLGAIPFSNSPKYLKDLYCTDIWISVLISILYWNLFPYSFYLLLWGSISELL